MKINHTTTQESAWQILTVILLLLFAMPGVACNQDGYNCMEPPPNALHAAQTDVDYAYVWANRPAANSYIASGAYQQNAEPILIHRVRTGFYNVQFGDIAAIGGVPLVSAYGANGHCQAASWRRGIVNVACFSPEGAALDTRFSLLYQQGENAQFLVATKPDAPDYTPDAHNRHWPVAMHVPRIHHAGSGEYWIDMGAVMPSRSNIQVAATGGQPTYCTIKQWTNRQVKVSCFAISNQQPVNSAFLLFLKSAKRNVAVVRIVAPIDDAALGPYNYNAGHSIGFQHQKVGQYSVILGEAVRRGGGNAQVTAMGGAAHCVIVSWSSSNVNVRCYNGTQPAESGFSLMFTERDSRSPSTPVPQGRDPVSLCSNRNLVVEYFNVGGIAGLMQHIRIYTDGCYELGNSRRRQLSAEQQSRLNAWLTRWQPNSYRHTDPPGQSDRMSIGFMFQGRGTEKMSSVQQGEIIAWLRKLTQP